MDKRLEPLIRHYIKLNYDIYLEGSKAMLTYHNLVLDYVEEEIHEGSRGPLPVNHSEESFKVPDKFGESTLFFKKSGVKHYKYDFVLLTDLSMLQTSKAGKELLEKKVLPYYDKSVKPAEHKQKLKEGELVNYISSHIVTSFDADMLRAWNPLGTQGNPIKPKETYADTLADRFIKNNFIPKHAKEMPSIDNKFQAQHDTSIHGSYVYYAFERIIQEQKSDNENVFLNPFISVPKAGLWAYVFYQLSGEPLIGLLAGCADMGFSLWMGYDLKKKKRLKRDKGRNINGVVR